MDEVRRAYGGLADTYIDLFGGVAAIHADDLEIICRNLAIRPGLVLDAGCGPGHLTEHLRSLDVDALGIDVTSEFVDHPRQTYPEARFALGSLCDLPLADGSVAGVLVWYSLIHLAPGELDGALAELRRVTTPCSPLVVGFFAGDTAKPFAHRVTTAHFWPADEFSARLRRAGFDEVERIDRPGIDESGKRPHAVIVAVAS